MKLSVRRWLALLGFVLFGSILYYAGLEAWQQILRADPGYLVLAFGVNTSLMTSSAVRWGLLTNTVVGQKVCSYLDYFYYFVLGRISGFFVSFNMGDYAVRPLALRATNSLSTGRMLYALMLDKLFDLLLAIGLLGPTLLFQLGWLSWRAYLFLVLLVFVSFYLLWDHYNRLLQAVLHFCSRRGQGLLRRNEKAVQWLDFLTSSESLVDQKTIRRAYAITILRFTLLTLYHYLVSTALHLPFSFLEFWMVIPIVQMGLIVAFTPGALGIMEVGWLGVLTLLGAAQLEINTFVIGQRIFFLIFTLSVGLLISPWIFIAKKSQASQRVN